MLCDDGLAGEERRGGEVGGQSWGAGGDDRRGRGVEATLETPRRNFAKGKQKKSVKNKR